MTDSMASEILRAARVYGNARYVVGKSSLGTDEPHWAKIARDDADRAYYWMSLLLQLASAA